MVKKQSSHGPKCKSERTTKRGSRQQASAILSDREYIDTLADVMSDPASAWDKYREFIDQRAKVADSKRQSIQHLG